MIGKYIKLSSPGKAVEEKKHRYNAKSKASKARQARGRACRISLAPPYTFVAVTLRTNKIDGPIS